MRVGDGVAHVSSIHAIHFYSNRSIVKTTIATAFAVIEWRLFAMLYILKGGIIIISDKRSRSNQR